MRFIGVFHSFPRVLFERPAVQRLWIAGVLLLPVMGCVSESTYEMAETDANNAKAELARTRTEIQALGEQKEALHKLNLEGETILAGIRSELQRSREAYAQYKAELKNMEALEAKFRMLRTQHTRYLQDTKAAKTNSLKMQAVLDGYEREAGQIPDRTEPFAVSQALDPSANSSRMVATVQPLSGVPSSSSEPASSQVSPPSTSPAAITSSASIPSPSVSPVAVPTQPTQPVDVPTASSPPKPVSQPPKQDDSWMGSLTAWFSSIWDWFFS